MIQNRPILIVEDDAAAAERLGTACHHCGYETIIVQNGSDVLATARRTQPRLILSDTDVPGLDGFETVRRIRATEALKETKVVALTQHIPSKPAANQTAFDGYVVKPIKTEDVTEVIKKLL